MVVRSGLLGSQTLCTALPGDDHVPATRRLRAAGSLLLLSLAGVPQASIAAQPQTVMPHLQEAGLAGHPQSIMPGRRGGRNRDRGPPGATSGKDLKTILEASPDPNDPHAHGFEPRPGPGEGGDMWAFGRAHAAVHHVLQHAPEGNATAIADMLDAFSTEHGLSFGLGAVKGQVVARAVHSALELVAADSSTTGTAADSSRNGRKAARSTDAMRRLHVLILNSGLGGVALRCLPALLEMGEPGAPHEVVSVEENDHLSDGGARLVAHALSGAVSDVDVRHTPLIPGDGTTFSEVLESLRDGYELDKFHLVFLGGDRVRQQSQVETLLEQGALRAGSVIHGEGPGREDVGTEGYLEFLERSGGRFDYEVHDTGTNRVAIVSTVRDRHGAEL
mmetsp:Transcript_48418/g.87646  ORF Transcript_48418/g.87646 Transcript_48418/m.87646 type:complete len:390 (+) Transcript_48418:58-1227(+)